MPVDRPTFSESWYRVAELRPRLRATVQIFRQHFRGQMWHVIQDPSSNQFFRLNEAAYRFVGMLDGKRTVADVWKACNEEMGDAAPTQGEVIQLLGQLYTSNLIHAEMPPDAQGLFNRYQKRVNREVKGYLSNLLFIRVPVFDPDRILDELLPAVRWIFSWIGLVVWAVLIAVAGYFVLGRAGELAAPAANILDPANLPLMMASFWIVKILHEFGHGFACKKFGRDQGIGGEVHTMGLMFLVFTPLPYVDASSAWAFRSKFHRVIVGMGGMIIELGVASIAAIIWARTGPGTLHAISYNIMFIASVSTLLFNANPLLRYDGYYILSDLLEIPNLSNRAKEYMYYLVKRYAWGVKRARNPAHSTGERVWFVTYGLASTAYRVVIVSAILLFVASKLFFLGLILAVGALAAWLLVPLGKLLKYLAVSGELARVRGRAMATVAGAAALLIGGLGFIPAQDRSRVEGVVEPLRLAFVHPLSDGFVREVTPSGQHVTPGDSVLIVAENPELEAQLKMLLAERRGLEARMRKDQLESIAAAQSLAKALAALDQQIADVRRQLADLRLRPPIAGRWISPEVERLSGSYVTRDQRIGLVASDEVVIMAVAGQDISARTYEEVEKGHRVEIRVKDRPDLYLGGSVLERMPAGQSVLPSAALGYAMGGSVQTAMDDPEGRKTQEPIFIIRITPDEGGVRLLSGERVIVRMSGRPKPLAVQWWRAILQLVQRRFHV